MIEAEKLKAIGIGNRVDSEREVRPPTPTPNPNANPAPAPAPDPNPNPTPNPTPNASPTPSAGLAFQGRSEEKLMHVFRTLGRIAMMPGAAAA